MGILSVVFPRYSHVFVTWREHGLPFPLIRSYPLLFRCPFSSIMFLSLPFLLRLYCPLVYIHYSHVFVTCRRIRSALFSYPLSFSRPFLQNAVLASRDGGPFGPRPHGSRILTEGIACKYAATQFECGRKKW